MTEKTELVPQDEVRLGALVMRPENVVGNATKVATALADVVKDRKLYSNIRNKKYVRVEGWNTLGAMLGVLPKEREVKEIENGYEAYVDLIRTSDGVIVGGASSICTRDENRWKNADPYAIRSMAVTRATGKAFRLGFSWIMKLAGYEATPAEEMDFVEAEYVESPKKPDRPDFDDLGDDEQTWKAKMWEKAKGYGLNGDQCKEFIAKADGDVEKAYHLMVEKMEPTEEAA